MTLAELKNNFDLFDDWEDRYTYLIDLGQDIAPMSDGLKKPENKVEGCISQVWMVCSYEPETGLTFVADSDSHIVKGLIAVLHALFDGAHAGDFSHSDIERSFCELGLDNHISPNRRNGFYAMVGRLEDYLNNQATN